MGIKALLLLVGAEIVASSSVGLASTQCELWCNHWTCDLQGCWGCEAAGVVDANGLAICNMTAPGGARERMCMDGRPSPDDYCTFEQCADVHCATCIECGPNYCATYCNQYTCDKQACAGCHTGVCSSAPKCNWWCNSFTCGETAYCGGCSICIKNPPNPPLPPPVPPRPPPDTPQPHVPPSFPSPANPAPSPAPPCDMNCFDSGAMQALKLTLATPVGNTVVGESTSPLSNIINGNWDISDYGGLNGGENSWISIKTPANAEIGYVRATWPTWANLVSAATQITTYISNVENGGFTSKTATADPTQTVACGGGSPTTGNQIIANCGPASEGLRLAGGPAEKYIVFRSIDQTFMYLTEVEAYPTSAFVTAGGRRA